MSRQEYSSQIVAAIRNYLKGKDIDCEFIPEDGFIGFIMPSKALGLNLDISILIRKDMYIVYATPLLLGKPLRIIFNIFDDEACAKGVKEMNDFVNKINIGLYIGNLEWYPDSGRVYSRCSVDCSGTSLSKFLIHRSISVAVWIWDLYMQGVCLIAEGKTSKEAIQFCREENAKEDQVPAYQKVQDMLAAASNSEKEDADAMQNRINSRFSRRHAGSSET